MKKKRTDELVPPIQEFLCACFCVCTMSGIEKIDNEAIAGVKIEPGVGWNPGTGVPQVEKKLDERYEQCSSV